MSDYNTGYKEGLIKGLYISSAVSKQRYLYNKYKAENQTAYHNCGNHQCCGHRADEAMTIQTLLEVAMEEVQDGRGV